MIDIIFIIPYRNREQHKYFFIKHMTPILEKYNYELIFVHQNDNRTFNRGAMKNIGFLYAKEKYENYKEITFVFHDIDTLPYREDLFNYHTTTNKIKHFYGFTFCLGGIFSIKGEDFEKINGFPNYWNWGYEDNVIQTRALKYNILIDRNEFKEFCNMDILHLLDNPNKIKLKIKKKDILQTYDGINTLKNINYNHIDNMLDVNYFECSIPQINIESINIIEEKDLKQTKSINLRKMF
tara:strand:+ start:547 stop:1260 length:714 start_codon:yes stop_codon:yes gene_type:complete